MGRQLVYLGVDVGSVSTNLVLLDAHRLDVVKKSTAAPKGSRSKRYSKQWSR